MDFGAPFLIAGARSNTMAALPRRVCGNDIPSTVDDGGGEGDTRKRDPHRIRWRLQTQPDIRDGRHFDWVPNGSEQSPSHPRAQNQTMYFQVLKYYGGIITLTNWLKKQQL